MCHTHAGSRKPLFCLLSNGLPPSGIVIEVQCRTTLPSQLMTVPWQSFIATPAKVDPSNFLQCSTFGMMKYQFFATPQCFSVQTLNPCEASCTSKCGEELPRLQLMSMEYPTRHRRRCCIIAILLRRAILCGDDKVVWGR
jgi:hypothetical protein